MEARARKLVARGQRTELFELMRKKNLERLTSGVWAKALERNDRLAHKLVDRAISALATALASTVNLLDVEAIVIGGGLGSRLGQPAIDRIATELRPRLFRPDAAPPVRLSALGDLAGATGPRCSCRSVRTPTFRASAVSARPRPAFRRARRCPVS
jgi:glucokinase